VRRSRLTPPLTPPLTVILVLTGCGSLGEATREEAEAHVVGGGRWPVSQRVRLDVARESPDLPAYPLVLPAVEGTPTVAVRSERAPRLFTNSPEGISHFQVFLAAGVEGDCLVRSDRLDLAQAFRRAHGEVPKRAAIVERHVEPLRLGRAGTWPLLLLRVEYLTDRHQYGSLRMAAANVRDLGIFCTLDHPGFASTFERMVTDLADSLGGPRLEERDIRWFHAVTWDGRLAGILEEVRRNKEDGGAVELSFTALVRPEGPDLSAVDDVYVEVTAAEGDLVLQRSIRQQDGHVVRDLLLNPARPHRHTVARGQVDRAEADHDLGTLRPSSQRESRALHRQALEDGTPVPHVVLRYVPGMDPTSLAEESFSLVGAYEEGGRFRASLRTPTRQVEAEYDVDGQGDRVRAMVTGGTRTIFIERLGGT
jgi:hypothetical protein